MKNPAYVPTARDLRFAAWLRTLPPGQRKAICNGLRAVAAALQTEPQDSQPTKKASR